VSVTEHSQKFIANSPTGKSAKSCPALPEKIFCFSEYPNQFYNPACLVPQRGGSRSSRTRGGMRWTRQRRRATWSQGGLRTRERSAACRRTVLVADGEDAWS
jgi:hypothetical protein